MEKSEISRRKLFNILSIGIPAILLSAGTRYQMMKEATEPIPNVPARHIGLYEARQDKTGINRQEYINFLLRNDEIPFCSGVIYDHDGTEVADYMYSEFLDAGGKASEKAKEGFRKRYPNGEFFAKSPWVVQLSERKRNSKTFVGRKFFETHSEFDSRDLRHCIVAHEGRHVEQHAFGTGYLTKQEAMDGFSTGKLSPEVYSQVGEVDALAHSLVRINSGEFKVRDNYLNSLKREFISGNNYLIRSGDGASKLQEKIIMRLNTKIHSFKSLRDVSLTR
ncbi:hypothetical protein COU54_03190 [Candidatus Pacearchaeota archaeon CG10_big_fil_rev_8_21_14_0_10_31_24]|nr:MAG: hypothetical protein COU54_03190 [Candidatus Pacearchaeota archaeon CG10_big_fil_rev_8_21_14_0_10_31_24]